MLPEVCELECNCDFFILQDLGHATIISPATVKSIELDAIIGGGEEILQRHGLAQIELDNGQCLHTRLVVGKDTG